MGGFRSVHISLVTTSYRIENIHQVLHTLLRQSRCATAIHLWLSDSPYLYDNGVTEDDIPPVVKDWIREGKVRLRWTENIGPYRKLIPLLKETWNQTGVALVTADDDTLYPPNWLEMLVDVAQRNATVAAYRCRVLKYRCWRLAKYRRWPLAGLLSPMRSINFLPTGKDGVLYRPADFSEEVFNDESFMRFCPKTDDIWFRAATLARKRDVARVNRTHRDFPEISSTGPALSVENLQSGNDESLRAAFAYFGIPH